MENALEFKPASTRYDTGRKFNGRIIWGQDFHCPRLPAFAEGGFAHGIDDAYFFCGASGIGLSSVNGESFIFPFAAPADGENVGLTATPTHVFVTVGRDRSRYSACISVFFVTKGD